MLSFQDTLCIFCQNSSYKEYETIRSIKFKQAYNYEDSKYALSFGIHIISIHGQE